MTRALLDERLQKVRDALSQRQRQHAAWQAALTENTAQINALKGREAELVELLALPERETE